MTAAVELDEAGLTLGARTLWRQLDLAVAPGEFIAVLGTNGAGKSSLLKVLLGLIAPTEGSARVLGQPATRGRRDVGYVPQHRGYTPDVAVRARDLVRFGVDGHRWGLGGGRAARARTEELIAAVGATAYADAPIGQLSGGEQQRLRVAQALAADPAVLLCDEPLQSLDLTTQRSVVDLIDRHRRDSSAAVVFVTHEINPVLPVVDRVLYLGNGTFRLGSVEEVMTTASLSQLYAADVEVVRHGDRLIVIGADDGTATDRAHHPHQPHQSVSA